MTPKWFELELIGVCDYRCLHCGIWERRKSPQELPFEAWQGLVREIASWAGPDANLSVTSGEPFLHPRLLELIGEASKLGIWTYLNTHGGHIDAPTAERVADSGLDMLWLSLDGLRPETHDHSRGVPGAHARVLRALDNLGRAGYQHAGLVTLMTERNLAELPDLARWAGDRSLRGISFQPMQPYGRDWKSLWPKDPAALSRALEGIEAARRAGAPILNSPVQLADFARYYEDPSRPYPEHACRSTETTIVENEGPVRFCRYMEPVGRIQSTSLRALWESAAGVRRRAETAACHKSCVLMGCHFPIPDEYLL
ncbi:MAG: radical SAM protein [Elusimicrobiota bacterium]